MSTEPDQKKDDKNPKREADEQKQEADGRQREADEQSQKNDKQQKEADEQKQASDEQNQNSDNSSGWGDKNFSIKTLPKSEVEIKITIAEDQMDPHRKKAAAEISKEVDVKGFRPGHVPPHVLEQHVDKKYIEARAQELAIQRAYADVVINEKLQVIARPKVEIEKSSPLTFTAVVAVMPEVKIKDYKSIKVKKEEPKVEKKDIEVVIEDMKKYGTKYKEVDRKAKKGDRVEVDFEGFDGDKPVENTKSSNHPVILGENSLIPGFEDELIGLKKGDKKEFDITFPKDYHKKDFQGKKLKFKVEVKNVEEAEVPELTEELIEKMTGQKKTVEEFKKDIEESVKDRKAKEAEEKQKNDYIEKLLGKTEAEVPEVLIEEETEFIIKDMKEDIAKKGLEFNKFLEQAKTTEEDLQKKYKPEAERRVKIRLALQQLVKEEGIEVSEKEKEEEKERVKSFYPAEQHQKIEDDYKNGNLGITIVNRLMLKKLFERVLG